MNRSADLAARTLSLIGDRAEAEVTVVDGTYALTRFANSFIHQNVVEDSTTVRLRVAIDGKVATVATTRTTPDALARFVGHALATAAAQPRDPHWPGLTSPDSGVGGGNFDPATASADPEERARAVQAFVAAGPGMRGAGYCSTEGWTISYANTSGHAANGRTSAATVDGIHQTDESAGSGHGTAVSLGALDPGRIGALAADRARRGRGAFDTKPGEYEVVLGPEAVATIAIFFADYALNGKLHNEGRAPVAVGDAAFDDTFELVDDPADPRAIGVHFDSEGTPARRLTFIAGGILHAAAHDRTSARIAGAAPTGHAAPGSETWGAMPSNLFVAGGSEPVTDLIAAVERGLYVATFNYCRVLDPKTLVVTGLTRNGTFMIENGELAGAVTNLRFTQSFVAGLGPGAVLGVGDDARFADSDLGPAMVHTPSVRLASWNFTGGAAG